MSERISIAELRFNARQLERGGVIEDWCAEPHELLALLEAVEAAHALAVLEEQSMSLDPDEHREAIVRHGHALARFDFGEVPA